MAQVVPSAVINRLPLCDLTLLLLSAYLHDIGMTPERGKVVGHHRYLLSGDTSSLDISERQMLQQWLDDNAGGLEPPLCLERPSVRLLNKADQLVAYYCRYRHNDWSEEWILAQLSPYTLGAYSQWIDDLVQVCRSHHEGYDKLKDETFNPKPAGQATVHLRYLACVLRIADILECDPERTPPVLFEHRDVAERSVSHWLKPHDLNISISSSRQIVIQARPKNAQMHKAILTTIAEIDQELSLCQRLSHELPFSCLQGLPTDLPHEWDLPSAVSAKVSPHNDNYVYIDGSFRPDTEKLLQLLAGTRLYGSPLVAVRELLQNAFDAVKEVIGRKRLRELSPADQRLDEVFGLTHKVELRLESEGDRYWLVCRDDGIGMTKRIIEDYVLVSGAAVRHDILELERQCAAAGFNLARTGQFGIGILSYFMLADRLIIETRRSSEASDQDPTGWRFQTDGVGAFGELRRHRSINAGTTIRLRLRNEIVEDAERFYSDLLGIVERTLAHVPCRFELNSALANCQPLALDPGWTSSSDRLVRRCWREIISGGTKYDFPDEVVSEKERERREVRVREVATLEQELMDSLRVKVLSGTLAGDLGRYRIHWFTCDVQCQPAFAFLRVDTDGNMRQVKDGVAAFPRSVAKASWKGMRVSDDFFRTDIISGSYAARGFPNNCVVEVDILSGRAGELSLNRGEFKPAEQFEAALGKVSDIARGLCVELVKDQASSSLARLNARIVKVDTPRACKPHWAVCQSNGLFEWKKVEFPVISSHVFIYGDGMPSSMQWKNKRVTVLPSIGGPASRKHYNGCSWASENEVPDRIVYFRTYKPVACPIWERVPRVVRDATPCKFACKFPPSWNNLLGIQFQEYSTDDTKVVVWNKSHPLVRRIDSSTWNRITEASNTGLDPFLNIDALLSDPVLATAWLLGVMSRGLRTLWDGLADRDGTFLPRLMKVVSGTKRQRSRPIEFVMHATPYTTGVRVTNSTWTQFESNEVAELLPDPGPEWTLTSQSRSQRQR
jgi:hypothetical protein